MKLGIGSNNFYIYMYISNLHQNEATDRFINLLPFFSSLNFVHFGQTSFYTTDLRTLKTDIETRTSKHFKKHGVEQIWYQKKNFFRHFFLCVNNKNFWNFVDTSFKIKNGRCQSIFQVWFTIQKCFQKYSCQQKTDFPSYDSLWPM